MNVVLVAIGSRGDLQPYLALGLGLQAAGHAVRLVSARNEQAFVEAHGLPFVALGVDVQQLLAQGAVGNTRGGNNPLRFFWRTLRPPAEVRALQAAVQEQLAAACRGADVLVYHPGQGLPFFLAQAAGQLSVLASPFPLVPTARYPAILFYRGQRLGAANRLTHALFDRMFWAFSKGLVRRYWQRHQASRPDFATSALRQQLAGGQPVLLGYSPQLFAPDPAWGPQVRVTGAWQLPVPPGFEPPPALAAFLAAGPEAPLYLGFGSMKSDAAGSQALLAEALRRTGQRAVVALGWSQPPAAAGPLPAGIFLLESVPHAWLFERVRAVVHHGGAGTVHAGLAAGRPTVVVPHHADQPAWGQRVWELGVGSRPIPRAQLTAARLADAIRYVLQPAVAARAATLGELMRQENGVATAVAALDAYAADTPIAAPITGSAMSLR